MSFSRLVGKKICVDWYDSCHKPYMGYHLELYDYSDNMLCIRPREKYRIKSDEAGTWINVKEFRSVKEEYEWPVQNH